MKFWVDTLGGKPMKFGPQQVDVVEFPGIFIFLRKQAPTGPTRGTTFDHIGFAVPNVAEVAARAVANGFQRTVGREPGPGQTAAPPTAGNYGMFEYLIGPDGVKVELVTNSDANAPPIKHHHLHFVNKQYVEMGQWYMKAFNATERPGKTDFFFGADLPGVGYMLNFFSWLPNEPLVGHGGARGRSRRLRGPQPRGVLQGAAVEGHRARRAVSLLGGAQARGCAGARSVGHADRAQRRAARPALGFRPRSPGETQ